MSFNKLDKSSRTWIIIAAVLVVVLLIPIKIPYKITVPGKVLPAKEWLIEKDVEGRLMTSLINNRAGVHESFAVRSFERGDAIHFSLRPEIVSGAAVSTIDTVGIIYSNESEKQLINLKASLQSQMALLEVSSSKEKEALVKEAEQGVLYAERQYIEQEKIYKRQKGMREKELISEEEFDLSRGTLDLFRINIDIAKERLNNVSTGEKQEQLDLIKTNIRGLQDEISVLEQKFSDYIIQSPINGSVNRVFSSDTLVIISDNTEYIVFMPLQWDYKEYIKEDQTVEFDLMDGSNTTGKIIALENSAKIIGQDVVSFATASYTGDNMNFMPGLLIECSVNCGELTPREHLFRFIESMLK
jgi:hypothetical protein